MRDHRSGRILITSQNHGYEVDKDSLSGKDIEIIYTSVNDGSVEGISLPEKHAFSVQFHPESAPGPGDARVIFEEFDTLMIKAEGI